VGAAEVAGVGNPCVTAGCAVCWLRQPEQKDRVIQAAMIIREIVFMISFVVEVIFPGIRFLDHGEGGASGYPAGLPVGLPSGRCHRNIKTIRYIEE
jgi:hypothetical protein